MNLDGWHIQDSLFADPPSLNVRQRLFESPTGKFAAVAYHVNEYRMGTEIARLAVFEDKSCPRLVLKQPNIWWLADLRPPAASWIDEATFAAVTMGRNEVPVVVVDVARWQFCFVHIPRGDNCNVQLSEGVLSLSAAGNDGVSRSGWRRAYADLHWFSLDRFADFFAAYEESAIFHGVPNTPIWQRIWAALTNAMDCVLFVLLLWPFRATAWINWRLAHLFGKK